MAGYKGYSMSNNAVSAYDNGLRPLSKWTLQDFVDVLADNEIYIKKVKGSYKNYLQYEEWHHSSKFYNRVDFYGIDYDMVKTAIYDGVIEVNTEQYQEIKVEIETENQIREKQRLEDKEKYETRMQQEKKEIEKYRELIPQILHEFNTCEIEKRVVYDEWEDRENRYIIFTITKNQPFLYNEFTNKNSTQIEDFHSMLQDKYNDLIPFVIHDIEDEMKEKYGKDYEYRLIRK